MLAENLSLREENIQLRNLVEGLQSRNVVDKASVIKDQFELKIRELGGLVAELASLSITYASGLR